MTRILRIITSADPRTGGPIEGARRMGEIWAGQGHCQDMVTLDPPEERHLPDYPGRITSLGPPRGRGLRERYRYSAAMEPWLRHHVRGYDAVIVSGLWRYSARGAMKALAASVTPYFVFPHGMLDPWFRRSAPLKHAVKQASWWWAEGPLLARARAVLFTSEEERRRAEGAFWPYRVRGAVVNYGTADLSGDPAMQVATFRSRVPDLADRRFLLFLGRLHPKKGCDLLIDAFAAVAAEAPDVDLVMAGPDQVGMLSALRARATHANVAARVHFPGMLEGAAKAGALRSAWAFVLPSHQENFGIAVAEALAAGTPVLVSDQVAIWREVLADGAGMVAPDTLAGTIDVLRRFQALSGDDQHAMRRRARRCFASRFDIFRAAESLRLLIEQEVR